MSSVVDLLKVRYAFDKIKIHIHPYLATVLPVKSDSDSMFCLQSYQGLIIDRSLVC